MDIDILLVDEDKLPSITQGKSIMCWSEKPLIVSVILLFLFGKRKQYSVVGSIQFFFFRPFILFCFVCFFFTFRLFLFSELESCFNNCHSLT